jgi:predicted transcriptional regulator
MSSAKGLRQVGYFDCLGGGQIVTPKGTFLGDDKLSKVTLRDLLLDQHHSIRLKIGIDDRSARPGGVNIFGRGFGNHHQDVRMRLHLARP